jgi:predicted GNAT family acetyltransferase
VGQKIHLFDTGHFALETHVSEIAEKMRDFLDRRLGAFDSRERTEDEPAELFDNTAEHRFELPLEAGEKAVSYYRIEDYRIHLLHTEVPQRLSGKGIGAKLATAVFEPIKRAGLRIVAKCPFMAASP